MKKTQTIKYFTVPVPNLSNIEWKGKQYSSAAKRNSQGFFQKGSCRYSVVVFAEIGSVQERGSQ